MSYQDRSRGKARPRPPAKEPEQMGWLKRAAGVIPLTKAALKATMSNTGKPKQVMQGWLTYAGIAITALTGVFQLFGKAFPAEEATALVELANSIYPQLVQGFGLIVALYGRLRREWRSASK